MGRRYLARFESARRWLLVLGAVLPGMGRAEPAPIPWRDPSPLGRLFLQPAFEEARRLPLHACAFDARVTEANNMLVAGDRRLSVAVDSETTDARLSLRCGITARMDAAVEIPLVAEWGGFLDNFIADTERALGAENPHRFSHLPFQTSYRFVRAHDGALVRTHPAMSVGDVSAALGWGLLPPGQEASLALRLATKVPTAPPTFGSQEVDVALSLLTGWSRFPFTIRAQFDLGFPTGRLRPLNIPLGPYAAVQLETAAELGAGVTVALQGSMHTSALRGTHLDPFQLPTWYVLLGATCAITTRLHVQLAIAENIFSYQRGADFSMVVATRWTWGPGS